MAAHFSGAGSRGVTARWVEWLAIRIRRSVGLVQRRIEPPSCPQWRERSARYPLGPPTHPGLLMGGRRQPNETTTQKKGMRGPFPRPQERPQAWGSSFFNEPVGTIHAIFRPAQPPKKGRWAVPRVADLNFAVGEHCFGPAEGGRARAHGGPATSSLGSSAMPIWTLHGARLG